MFELDFEDSALSSILDKVFSGLLPHENYDKKSATSVLDKVFSYISLSEFKLEYYVLASILANYRKITFLDRTFVPVLERSDLDRLLESELYELILNPSVGMYKFLLSMGLGTDLENPVNQERAANELYNRVMTKYDELLDMKTPTDSSLSSVVVIKEILMTQVYRNHINVLDKILTIGHKFGRKYYRGSLGCHNYSKDMAEELDKRLEDTKSALFTMTIDNASEIWDEMRTSKTVLYDSHMVPFNSALGVLKSRLIVFVSEEGGGKTANAVTMAAQAGATKGIKTVLAITESDKGEVLSRYLTSYVYFKHGIKISSNHLASNVILPEAQLRMVRLCQMEIAEKQLFNTVEAPHYDKIYEQFKSYYIETEAEMFIVDHSGDLDSDPRSTEAQNIGNMTKQLIKFKRDFKTTVVVNSHESSIARELMGKGKKARTASTRGSVKLSQGADDLIIIMNNDEYRERDIRAFFVAKSRGGPEGLTFMMALNRSISTFQYVPELQELLDKNTIEKEQLSKELVEKYKNEHADVYDPDQTDFEMGYVGDEETVYGLEGEEWVDSDEETYSELPIE